MKNFFVLLILLVLYANLTAQNVKFSYSIISPDQEIIIGRKNYDLLLYSDSFSFERTDYLFSGVGFDIKIDVKGFTNDSIILRINEIPNDYRFIGMKDIQVYSKDKILIGTFTLPIQGKTPTIDKIYNKDNLSLREITIDDPVTTDFIIEGDNLSSIDLANFKIQGLDIRNKYIQSDKLLISAKSNVTSPMTSITISYPYKEYNNGVFNSVNNPRSLPFMIKPSNSAFLEFQPNYVYDYDKPIVFKIIGKSNFTGNYTVDSKNSELLSSSLDNVQLNEARLTLSLNPNKIVSGMNEISLIQNGVSRFSGKFEIKKMPEIVLIKGGFNNLLEYNPFLDNQELIIEGDNLDDISLEFKSKYIHIEEKGIDQKIERRFSILFNDSIPSGEYPFIIKRGKFDRRGLIKVVTSPRPFNFMKFISLNDTLLINKKNYTFSSDDKLHFELIEDSIPSDYGNQSISISLFYFNEEGKLLTIREIQKNKSAKIITHSKSKDNYPSFYFDINETGMESDKDQIQPWGYVIIEISYTPDYYLVRSNLIDEPRRLTFIFNGKEKNLWHVEMSVPPALFVFGGRGNGLIGQFLPVNFGIGIVRDFRKENTSSHIRELSQWDIGLYIAGLNFAAPSTSNLGFKTSKIDSTLLVQNTDVSIMLITKYHFSKNNRNWAIPMGFGYIPPFIEEKHKFFFTFGITYSFGKAN